MLAGAFLKRKNGLGGLFLATSRESSNKIHKYRKPLNLNIGMILFGVIFIYIIVCVVLSFKTTAIAPYEVKEGSLVTNYTYRGIAIRDEIIFNSDKAGYVNFYAREGERVATGDLVYSVDETGELSEYLSNATADNTILDDNQLTDLRNDIVYFMHGFDATNYDSTYDFKYQMKGTVLRLANATLLDGLKNLTGGKNGLLNGVSLCYAPNTGIISYWVDGYETLPRTSLTKEHFSEKNYEVKRLLDNELITSGDEIYKLSTNENWSLVVPIEENDAVAFLEEEYIKVRFLKNQVESWGKVDVFKGADGQDFMELSFTNSMVTFAKDRFIDIELLLNDETGLKIPNTSIVEKEFFLVPEDYLTQNVTGNNYIVLKETYSEDGNILSEAVEVSIYNYDSETKEYYVSKDALSLGTRLIKTNSQEKYTISKQASLIGVYNINKGYADFRRITLLYQNDEYSIVNSNTKYGLNVYDNIVLDARAVMDEQLLYN